MDLQLLVVKSHIFIETMLTHEYQISTIRLDSPIAQLVEQRTVNPFVAGSSPARGAIFKARL